jgi:sigma-54 dependent transcriptional regulator, acetoin dehydrogenase operon transcriptional activator AcoR
MGPARTPKLDEAATLVARERFACTGAAGTELPRLILESWSRSRSCGVPPDRREARFAGTVPPSETRLVHTVGPVLAGVADRLKGTDTAVLLSDRGARILKRWAGDVRMARLMDRVHAAEGFVLAEEQVGTNGVGTPLEAGEPVAVVGTAHYNEVFDEAACVGAPIRNPLTRRVEGVVSLTCRTADASPLQLAIVLGAVQEAEQRLLEQATARERRLLASLITARRRTAQPLVCVGEDIVLATPAAARLLEGVDQGLLWDRARRTLADGRGERALALDDDAPLRATCEAVLDDGAVVGVLIEVTQPAGRRAPRRVPASLGDLAGASAAWRRVCADVRAAAEAGVPLALVGEPGVGKLALAQAAAELRGRAVRVVACGRGAPQLGPLSGTVVLRGVDALSERAARRLAEELASAASEPLRAAAGEPPWLVVTAADPASPGARTLLARVAVTRVEVPPLRLRPDDIPVLARALARRHGSSSLRQSVRPEAAQLLARLPWPGNVRELEHVIRLALQRRHVGDLRIDDLPADIRPAGARNAATALQRLEAEAIVEALAAADGNKRVAAQALGVSRSTLYRKLRAYGIELDRLAY